MNQLAEARRQKGITSTQLAAYIGVTEQTVRRWEKKKDISHIPCIYLLKASEILDKSINFFVNGNSQ